jgi:sugar phosphate isomerase/epimerase
MVGKSPELMNLYWSAAGIFPGDAEISPLALEDRAQSAARAGFGGLSFWHTDIDHMLETRSLVELRSILDGNGLGTFEVEFLEDWFVDGEARARSDLRRHRLFEAAERLDAHHVKVGDFHTTPTTMPQLIDSFGGLCADAASHGVTIGCEFMASAMIHRLADCLEMVTGAGAANGGLIVDIAHTNALGISNAAVAGIPKGSIVSVELNDNLRATTHGYDPAARRYCGDGELDVRGFIAAARLAGYNGPWAVEVFNRRLSGVPLAELDRVAFDTTIAMFTTEAPWGEGALFRQPA